MRTARTLVGAALLFVLGLMPQTASACVATYADFNVDTTQAEVEAWAWVEDYYDQSPCFDEIYSTWPYWEHRYEAYVQIQSPTTNSAYDYQSTWYVPYGGGSASAFSSLSVEDDPGVYSIDWQLLIFCIIGQYFFGDGGNDVVEVPYIVVIEEYQN
jgi:hypothetical protein